jgi:hypothetical protein
MAAVAAERAFISALAGGNAASSAVGRFAQSSHASNKDRQNLFSYVSRLSGVDGGDVVNKHLQSKANSKGTLTEIAWRFHRGRA